MWFLSIWCYAIVIAILWIHYLLTMLCCAAPSTKLCPNCVFWMGCHGSNVACVHQKAFQNGCQETWPKGSFGRLVQNIFAENHVYIWMYPNGYIYEIGLIYKKQQSELAFLVLIQTNTSERKKLNLNNWKPYSIQFWVDTQN